LKVNKGLLVAGGVAPGEEDMTLSFKMPLALCLLIAALVAIAVLPRRSKARLDEDPMARPYGDWPTMPP
jgi:hypothetical protein